MLTILNRRSQYVFSLVVTMLSLFLSSCMSLDITPVSTSEPEKDTSPMDTTMPTVASTTIPTPEIETITYTVQAGDTLGKIATAYDVTVEDLLVWNDIEDANLIEVGQVLTITRSTATEAPTKIAATATPYTVTTAEGETISSPGRAYMDGRDLEANPVCTLMTINIWDAVPRKKAVCQLAHGQSVAVIAIRYYGAESRYYFRVRSGDCEGYVSESFLSAQKHDPVGDQL